MKNGNHTAQSTTDVSLLACAHLRHALLHPYECRSKQSIWHLLQDLFCSLMFELSLVKLLLERYIRSDERLYRCLLGHEGLKQLLCSFVCLHSLLRQGLDQRLRLYLCQNRLLPGIGAVKCLLSCGIF